jgi:hypothetical protein
MSLQDVITAGCAGKERFSDPAVAKRALNRKLRSPKFKPQPDRRMQVYRCTRCTGWHIGSGLAR